MKEYVRDRHLLSVFIQLYADCSAISFLNFSFIRNYVKKFFEALMGKFIDHQSIWKIKKMRDRPPIRPYRHQKSVTGSWLIQSS